MAKALELPAPSRSASSKESSFRWLLTLGLLTLLSAAIGGGFGLVMVSGIERQVEEKYKSYQRVLGKVRNTTSYGAFVELEDGVDGLLHINDMSWTKKVVHPNEVVKKGEQVDVVVLSVDKEKKRIAQA